MVKKIPPPPPIANQDPTFNRWLVELINLLNNDGTISDDAIGGLDGLKNQVATNTSDIQQAQLNITSLAAQVSGSGGDISALTDRVSSLESATSDLQTRMSTVEASIVTLTARPQVRYGTGVPAGSLGGVDDWYANTTGTAGSRIYVKTGASTWTLLA